MPDSSGPFTVYCAHHGEERGRGALIAVCSTEVNAKAQAAGKGWYGGDGDVIQRKAVKIDGKVYLLDEFHPKPVDLDGEQAKVKARIRQEALKKLSDVEKDALGLKSP